MDNGGALARFETFNCLECGHPMMTFSVPNVREIHQDQLARLERDLIALAVAHHLYEISEREAVGFGDRAVTQARAGKLRPGAEEQMEQA